MHSSNPTTRNTNTASIHAQINKQINKSLIICCQMCRLNMETFSTVSFQNTVYLLNPEFYTLMEKPILHFSLVSEDDRYCRCGPDLTCSLTCDLLTGTFKPHCPQISSLDKSPILLLVALVF